MKKIPSEFDDLVGLGEIDAGEAPELPVLPWEQLDYNPKSGPAADSLIKRAKISAFVDDVLGAGSYELATPKPKADVWNAFNKRAGAISETTMQTLMTKATRVATGAPVRKRAISERIIEPFKKALIDKGLSTVFDGWDALLANCESLVTASLMAVE
jgi:hypothetical protein